MCQGGLGGRRRKRKFEEPGGVGRGKGRGTRPAWNQAPCSMSGAWKGYLWSQQPTSTSRGKQGLALGEDALDNEALTFWCFLPPPTPTPELLGIPHFLVGKLEPWRDFPHPGNLGHFPTFSITSPPTYQLPHTQRGLGRGGDSLLNSAPGADTLSAHLPKHREQVPSVLSLRWVTQWLTSQLLNTQPPKAGWVPIHSQGRVSPGVSQPSPLLFQ